MQRPTRRTSLTPEEKMARALRARCRFKAAIRFVLENLYWLADIEEETLGDNVQKNVLLLTRKKSKNMGLTLQQKYVLNKPTEHRTEEEKLRLFQTIGGLKCFRRYPEHVKSQLAGLTYFYYYKPGRTVVRQGDESHALYFISTGIVHVFQDQIDPVLDEHITVSLGTKGPGGMFGEVALLHNIPRTATIITETHCELLCLKKDDFDRVLKATVQQQWDDVQNTMRQFSYFQYWDSMAIRDCCILSKINIYVATQTILGDGHGLLDHVYFILKGKCQVIEQLQVLTYVRNKKKCYKLHTVPIKDVASVKTSIDLSLTARGGARSASALTVEMGVLNEDIEQHFTQCDHANHREKPKVTPKLSKGSTISPAKPEIPSHRYPIVKTHFMQVCFLNSMACFGIGENMNNRRVVAVTPTQCLLIPRYWLMQRNIGNVWHKVLHFLNSHVPTTEQVFKKFVSQRKWLEYRKETFHESFKRHLPNINSRANVPYFIRVHNDTS